MSQQEWHITLNKYQRDNLLGLLNATGYPYPTADALPHIKAFQTGDWVGEIALKLRDEDGNMVTNYYNGLSRDRIVELIRLSD